MPEHRPAVLVTGCSSGIGAAVAVIGWIAISFGFSRYLSHSKNFNAIYGAFAGAIALVVWVWLSNVAMLFGAELNARLQGRGRGRGAQNLL